MGNWMIGSCVRQKKKRGSVPCFAAIPSTYYLAFKVTVNVCSDCWCQIPLKEVSPVEQCQQRAR